MDAITLADDDIVESTPTPRASSIPPPLPRRTLAPKPIDKIREAVGELEFFATAWQASGVCATALARTFGARAVLVHLYDEQSEELRTVAIDSQKPNDLLGSSENAGSDLIVSAVTANGKPVTMTFDDGLPRSAPERLRKVDASRSLVAVPVLAAGGCVAIIELVDAADPRKPGLAEACAFVASRLAQFLSTRRAA